MMDNELGIRIKRLYEATSEVRETDLTKIAAQRTETETRVGIDQDFRGQMNAEQLANRAHILIALVASLRDHLQSWARQTHHDGTKIKETFEASRPLKIVTTLYNREKHADAPRKPCIPGDAQVANITRRMRLTTGAEDGSGCAVTLNRKGTPVVLGCGSAVVVTTGDVVDGNGNSLGELYDILLEAVAEWEALLTEFGVPLPNK